jgi:LPXTG-motif cell wall-anchored protein
MKALAIAYALAAALVAPALLWASDEAPGDDPAAAPATTTTTTTSEPAPPPPPPEQPPPAPAAAPAAAPAPEPEPASTPAPARTASKQRQRPVARAAGAGGVTIADFSFRPSTITVDVGDTVTWTNQDSAPHNAVADNGSFETRTLNRGQSDSHTFSDGGTFSYICTIHPQMRGTVVVRGSGGGGGAGAGAAGTGSGSADSGSGAAAGSTDSGSSLPATGLDAAIVALAGVALLGGGMALRRRLRP